MCVCVCVYVCEFVCKDVEICLIKNAMMTQKSERVEMQRDRVREEKREEREKS